MTLLSHYTFTEIFMFVIVLAVSVQQCVNFFEWVKERVDRLFNKEHNNIIEKKQLEHRLQQGSDIMDDLKANQDETDATLKDLSDKIDMLINSDKDSIKAYITQRHHWFCYEKGWIDDFSLDCLEKRYQHYEDEGGNSFIGYFMDELRALPKKQGTAPPIPPRNPTEE